MKNIEVAIGIDPGTKTGLSMYLRKGKELEEVKTCKIHEAMEFVKEKHLMYEDKLLVRVEDARQRRWFGKGTREQINAKKQGAGSVKRDCSIWEDFLKDLGIEYHMVAPSKGTTKVNQSYFQAMTGYKKRTSEHGRDAAMLVYGI